MRYVYFCFVAVYGTFLSFHSLVGAGGNDVRPELYSLNEAATLLGVHHTTLRRMVQRGEIPAVRVGKLWKFSRRAVEEWIEAGGTAAPEARPKEARKGA
jgi:excisionase family DNA binding protein